MNKIQLIAACTLALFTFVKIPLMGELFFGDLLGVVLLPFAIANFRSSSLNRWFVPLGVIVITYTLILDYVVDTPRDEVVRALARNATMLINFVSAGYVASRWSRYLPLILLCMGISLTTFSIVQPSMLAETDPWKVGISQGTFLILIAISVPIIARTRLRNAALPTVSVILFSLIFAYAGLINDSRTSLLIGISGATFGILFGFNRRVSPLTLGLVIAGLALLIPAFFQLYLSLAETGLLGEDTANRMEYTLNTHRTDSAFFAARYNTFEAIRASLEAFPIGMGSFPDGISYHSHIITAIVESGLFGAIFWLNALSHLSAKLWRNTPHIDGAYFGVYAMTLIMFIETVLFEPMQGYNRLLTPMYFALLSLFLPLTSTGQRTRGLDRTAVANRRRLPLDSKQRAGRTRTTRGPRPTGDQVR